MSRPADDDDDFNDLENDETPSGAMGRIGEFVRSWGPAIFAVLFIRTFIFEPFRIPSGSMVPTLLIGDHVAVSKFSYGIWVPATVVEIPFLEPLTGVVIPRFELLRLGDPDRGDIVVFRYPRDEKVNYIKRIVGLPGDRIRVRDNKIYVNDVEMKRRQIGSYEFVDATCSGTSTRHYMEDLEGLEHHVLTSKGMGSRLSNMTEKVVPPESVFVMGDNRDFSEDSRAWDFVRYDQIKGKAHLVWLSWDGCDGDVGSVRTERFFQSLY